MRTRTAGMVREWAQVENLHSACGRDKGYS